MGKVGLIAIVYFEIVSTIAIVFGLAGAYLLGVGKGIQVGGATSAAVDGARAAAEKAGESNQAGFSDFLLHVFPDNFFGAFAKGELLQVLVIAVIFGVGLLALKPAKRSAIESGLASISDAFFEFINLIMKLAPVGTFGAIAYAVGSNGTDVLISLAWLVLAFYAAVVAFIVVVLGAVSWAA